MAGILTRLATWADKKLTALEHRRLVAGLPTDPQERALSLRPKTVTSADANWRDVFLRACESPAECAFLEAMISTFDLRPDMGVLRGEKIALRLQLPVESYRLDFALDDWLAIEIDGAAFHSSPEAIERDHKRDEFLKSTGWTVLRIPARTVFETPGEAINLVRSSLAAGSQNTRPTIDDRIASKARTLKRLPSGIMEIVTAVNRHVCVATEVGNALRPLELAVAKELGVLELCVEGAKLDVEREAFFRSIEDAELQASSRASYDRITKALTERRASKASEEVRSPIPDVASLVPAPHPDEEVDREIRSKCQHLLDDRQTRISALRSVLEKDATLSELARKHLHDLRHVDRWQLIAPSLRQV